MWKRDAIFRIQISNEGKSRNEEIGKTSFVIGRGDSSDLQITAASVSRTHLNVELRNGEIWIKDLGSSSGTKLNGVKLNPNKPEIYKPGDTVTLGLTEDVLTFALAKDDLTPVPLQQRMNRFLFKMQDATKDRFKIERAVAITPEETVIDQNPEAKTTALRIKIAAETEAAKIIQQAKDTALSEVSLAREKAADLISKATDEAFRIQKESEIESEKMRQVMQETITKAQQDSEQKIDVFRSESREKSEKTIREAREKGDKILRDYQSQAEKLLSDARLTAAMAKADAQKEADDILARAYQKTTDLKNSWESEANNFHKEEKKKSEAFLSTAQNEADRILEEARRSSSMTRAKMEKELDEIKQNADREANTIISEARKSIDEEVVKIRKEAESVASKTIALAKEETEKQKSGILKEAIEEGAKIKDEAARQARKEALTLQKNAENDRSDLSQIIEKLSQEILSQERKKVDITEDVKTLLKKQSDAKDQLEALAKKLAQSEIETNRRAEGLRAKLLAVETLLEEKTAEVEKNKRESQKILDTAKQAESLTANAREEKDRLTKIIEDLKKEKIQLTKGLEAEKKRLREAAENEINTFKEETHAEVKHLRDKAQADYNQRKIDQEAEFSKMRRTELEIIKGLRTEEETRFKGARKHHVLEITKALETYLSSPKPVDVFSEIKGIVETVLEEEFKSETTGTVNSSSKKKRKTIYIGLGAGLAVIFALFFVPYGDQEKRKPASLLFIERLHEKEAQRPKFIPQTTDEYKETYTANVIYTKDYVNFKLNPDNQSKWIQDLNKFFINDLGLNENAIVKFISIESNLVSQLKDLRAVIHYENQKEDIRKMTDLEKDTVKEMVEVMGTQEKYKSFREFEKKYYSINHQRNSNTYPAPVDR